MQALVTGANGFIGSNLVKHLLKNGVSVTALVRKTSDLSFLEGLNIRLVYGDITDKSSLQPAMKDKDWVFHVAGLASDWGPYQRFFYINVKGTQNVAEIAAKQQVRRMIHISTVAFHGFGYQHISEDYAIAKNLIPYAETKYLAEKWLFEFVQGKKLEATAIRPGNVFGPNDHTFMEKYLAAIQKKQAPQINHGKSKTCPTYIENLIDAIYLAAQRPEAVGEAFFITDGLDITWNEFNNKLAKALGTTMPALSIPYSVGHSVAALTEGFYKLFGIKSEPFLTKYRVDNGGKDYHFSIEKAKRLLGYLPAINIDEAVSRTVKWYLNTH